MMTTNETDLKAMLAKLARDPMDVELRGMLADWYEDAGNEEESRRELVNIACVKRKKITKLSGEGLEFLEDRQNTVRMRSRLGNAAVNNNITIANITVGVNVNIETDRRGGIRETTPARLRKGGVDVRVIVEPDALTARGGPVGALCNRWHDLVCGAHLQYTTIRLIPGESLVVRRDYATAVLVVHPDDCWRYAKGGA